MAFKPVVYYGSVRSAQTDADHSIVAKFDAVVSKLGIGNAVKERNVAIKMHLGGNVGFSTVHPFLVGRLVDFVKKAGGRPCIVDTGEAVPEAYKRGYTSEVVGCPILPLAGLSDRYYVEKEINYKGLKTLRMGGFVKDFDVLIGLAHLKGHNTVGFGGAIKNLALGCFTKRTRWGMHDTMQYDTYWDERKSKDADLLVRSCPFGAIRYKDGRLKIEFDQCNQCMRCVEADTDGCIQIRPENFLAFPEINAISTGFVLSHFDKDKTFYVNVALDITEFCDCWGFSTGEILPDLGILGSRDIVAVDKASLDLLVDKPLLRENVSQNLEVVDDSSLHPFARVHGPYKDPYNMVRMAQKYGLGQAEYTLEEVLPPAPEPKRSPAKFPKLKS